MSWVTQIRGPLSLAVALLGLPATSWAEHEASWAEQAAPWAEHDVVRIEPAHPTPADLLHLHLVSACPAQTSYDPPTVELTARTVRLVQRFNAAILAPCLDHPVGIAAFDLGPFPEGRYTFLHFTIEVDLLGRGEPPEEPDFSFTLEIREATPLLLLGGRLEARSWWRDHSGTSGPARPAQITPDSGLFWFFQASNVEVVVKVLDACPLDGHTWLFAAGLTNLEVEIEVRDVESGTSRTYRNPLSRPFQPIQDTETFSACP